MYDHKEHLPRLDTEQGSGQAEGKRVAVTGEGTVEQNKHDTTKQRLLTAYLVHLLVCARLHTPCRGQPFGYAYESPQSAEGSAHVADLDKVATSTTRKLSAPPTVPNVAWFERGTFDLSSSAGTTYGHWPNSVQGGSNAAFCCGYMSEVSQSGHGADSVVRALHGTTSDSIIFGDIIKTQFTICSVTRYTGGVSERILTSGEADRNWLHGHWLGKAGIAFYESWKTTMDVTNVDPITDWVVMCGTNAGSQLTLVNGANKGTATGGQGGVKLVVNSGRVAPTQNSDFAIAEVMVWDRGLTSEEIYGVSDHLMIKFGVGGMAASPTHTPTSSPIKTDVSQGKKFHHLSYIHILINLVSNDAVANYAVANYSGSCDSVANRKS